MVAKEKPKEKPEIKPNVKPVKGGNPKQTKPQGQPQMTEEEAFASYANTAISNTILDIEATKSRTVDTIKALIQQLSMYINTVKKLQEENKVLEEKLKKK